LTATLASGLITGANRRGLFRLHRQRPILDVVPSITLARMIGITQPSWCRRSLASVDYWQELPACWALPAVVTARRNIHAVRKAPDRPETSRLTHDLDARTPIPRR